MSMSNESDDWRLTRRLTLFGAIDNTASDYLIEQLLFLAQEDLDKPIELHINSPTGAIISGLAIYDTIKALGCPVHTSCTGIAAGIAVLLLAAGERGSRAAIPEAEFALVAPRIADKTGFEDTDAQRQCAQELSRLNALLGQLLGRETGVPQNMVTNLTRSGDYYFGADEAVRLGIIDSIRPYDG